MADFIPMVYVTGPARTPLEVDRLARLAGDLIRVEQHEAIFAFPQLDSTPTERLRWVADANVVVLVSGWELDPQARRDAQVAVWCNKVLRVDGGLRQADDTPTLIALDGSRLQEMIDRGIALPIVPEAADEAAEDQGSGGVW